MKEQLMEIIPLVMKLVFYAIGLLLTYYILPWAKQQIWYSVIKKFVQAAEKQAEAGNIEKPGKKNYVLSLMKMFHIPINDITLALMESAVQELDILKNEMMQYLVEDSTGEDEEFNLEEILHEFGEGSTQEACQTP